MLGEETKDEGREEARRAEKQGRVGRGKTRERERTVVRLYSASFNAQSAVLDSRWKKVEKRKGSRGGRRKRAVDEEVEKE